MNGGQQSNLTPVAAQFKQPWIKKHGIPMKSCIKCGNVWKLKHYCPAEHFTCQKCYRTGHLTQYCFTYKNKSKKKSQEAAVQSNSVGKCEINNTNNGNQQKEFPINRQYQPSTTQTNAPGISSSVFPVKNTGSASTNSQKSANSSKKSDNKNNTQRSKNQNKSRDKNQKSSRVMTECELQDLKGLANRTYQQKKYRKASILYSRLIEHFPKDPEYLQNRAFCFMMMEQYENSLADAAQAIEIKPTLIECYATLISCSVKLGCIMEAKCYLKKLSELDYKNKTILSEQTKLIQLHRYQEREKIALIDENYQDALENVNKCLLISSKDLRLKIKKAEYLAMLKRYDEAQKVVGEILEKDPTNSEVKFILSIRIYYIELNDALNYFNQILQVDPDNLKIINFKKNIEEFLQRKTHGNNAFAAGDYKCAHEHYSAALKIDPKHTLMKIQLYFNMAQASWNQRNYAKAIEEYTKVIQINSIHLNALKQRGKCYLAIDEFEKATADFIRVNNLNPTDPHCLALMSEAKAKQSELKNGFSEKNRVGE